MAEYTLENDCLKVIVASKGCEILSVINKNSGREYIWEGNPDAWKRHAPVLFPLIGRYKNDESVYAGKKYHMTQHGFARDMEFELVSHNECEIRMSLNQTEETKVKFPFNFKLELGYTLKDNTIIASYRVYNNDEKEMYFSIGGHPAFAAPANNKCANGAASLAGCELLFEDASSIKYGLLNPDGLLEDDLYDMKLKDSKVTITEDFFDKDALIVENNQCHKVSLLENGKKFVTVEFDAPVFGIWSAANKKVPFVCIEPWYGRTDRVSFTGELEKREWGNKLGSKETFSKEYRIIFG